MTQRENLSFLIQRENAMQITIDLPDELIEEAMFLANAKTPTQVIVLALEELIKKYKVAELKNSKDKLILIQNADL